MLNSQLTDLALPLALTQKEFLTGCRKTVEITRTGMNGYPEVFNLEVAVPQNSTKGTMYVYDGMGDYLGNGMFQNITVILEVSFYPSNLLKFRPSQLESYDSYISRQNSSILCNNNNLWNKTDSNLVNNSIDNNLLNNFISNLGNNLPNNILGNNLGNNLTNNNLGNILQGFGNPSNYGSNLSPFTSLNVFKPWDFNISYFPNGDVGLQLRIPLDALNNKTLAFEQILVDGSKLYLPYSKLRVIGTPDHKNNLFIPIKGSKLTGNVVLLVIVDMDTKDNQSSFLSFFCC